MCIAKVSWQHCFRIYNGVTWSVHFRKTVMETQLVSEGGVNICPTDISLLLTASLSMSPGSCISLSATTEPSRQKYLVHTLLYRPCLSPQEWPTMWNVFFFFFVTLYKTPSPAPPTTFTLTASTLLRDPCRSTSGRWFPLHPRGSQDPQSLHSHSPRPLCVTCTLHTYIYAKKLQLSEGYDVFCLIFKEEEEQKYIYIYIKRWAAGQLKQQAEAVGLDQANVSHLDWE